MWLKALGHSYAEIGQVTGFSATKVNRCLTEGRKTFLERFEGIETGKECERWQTVLSAMVDGEATAAQMTDVRPHLRNCSACRATLRGLHRSERSLSAVLPVGLVAAGMKLTALFERFVPGVASDGPVTGAAGGAGLLGLGGMKLAGLVAAGAAATAGGGLVVAHERDRTPAAAHRQEAHAAPAAARGARPSPTSPSNATHATRAGATASTRPTRRHRLVARRQWIAGRIEFAPAGGEAAVSPAAAPVATATAAASAPTPVKPSAPSTADTTRGEFAPRP